MYKLNKLSSSVYLLLFILVAGPLQAQVMYACTEIEKAVGKATHNTNDIDTHSIDLCSGHEECVSIDCKTAFNSSQGLCCEESPIISIDQDLQKNIPIISSIVESDIDPPQAENSSFESIFKIKPVSAFVVLPSSGYSSQVGSNTYLITQRLRI